MIYDTSNTRLAAALKALGFTLVTYDAGDQTNFKFEDSVLYGKRAGDYNMLWREKEWHEFNPNHPFCHIVKAAEARDWIINRVIHDNYQDVGGENQETYFVYDINIATCIIADGYYLLRHDNRRFYFIGTAEKIHRAFAAPVQNTPLWWQCNYLKQLRLLMSLLPHKNKLDKAVASA
jgi:hypothetical protein